ncbi:MAG: hypothetical protein KDD36_00645 [Flavobacteriales bacterium]|nr:hypothetical protein [Flavobacteriales bacterium]
MTGLLILVTFSLHAQQFNVMPGSPSDLSTEGQQFSRADSCFNAVYPITMDLRTLNGEKHGLKVGHPVKQQDLLSFNNQKWMFNVAPVYHFQGGLGTQSTSEVGGGFRLRTGQAKWSFEMNGIWGASRMPPYISTYIDSFEVIPGTGRAKQLEDDLVGWRSRRIQFIWTPSRHFQLQAGRGKNFIGNGYRSLLLSYNPRSSPYLRLTTRVWKMQYTNLFLKLEHINGASGQKEKYQGKYAAMHFLDWHIGRALSLGIFEAVVWQHEDSEGIRGFDINYLNPFIFYRPVEFSLGSPDNVLMGLNVRIMTGKKSYWYGQACLDEFFFQEIRKWDGWSSNKQGVQMGWRVVDVLGKKGLSVRFEANYVRPYTYTHVVSTQNYTHFNEALAHPLRANFVEGLFRLQHISEKWMQTVHVSMALYGDDSTGTHMGRNLFIPYPDTRGNHVAQGIKTGLVFCEVTCRKWIGEGRRTNAFASLVWRMEATAAEHKDYANISVGISTWFPSRYLDF